MWPRCDVSRAEQTLLSDAALTALRLNGQFLAVAEELARPANLTAAGWQVLGAVLSRPLPVASIARDMGITRQSVQRIADLLVDRGLAEYRPNPAHQRAKLVAPTEAGRRAVAGLNPGHAAFARRLVRTMGADKLSASVAAMHALSNALAAVTAAG